MCCAQQESRVVSCTRLLVCVIWYMIIMLLIFFDCTKLPNDEQIHKNKALHVLHQLYGMSAVWIFSFWQALLSIHFLLAAT